MSRAESHVDEQVCETSSQSGTRADETDGAVRASLPKALEAGRCDGEKKCFFFGIRGESQSISGARAVRHSSRKHISLEAVRDSAILDI
jgi:hypothetical protein